jgi:hypothetical protein
MSKKHFLRLGVFFTILLLSLGVFAKIMTYFDHNEHMYIIASVFVRQGKDLYKDFAYVQMPNLPLLYGYYFRIFDISSLYLFWGKLFSFLFFGVAAAAIFGLSLHISKQMFFSVSILLLFLLNETVLRAAQEVSNYIAPLSLSLLGFYLFIISYQRTKFGPLGMFLAGLFIALAAGTRLLYVVIIPPFAIAVLFFPRSISFSKRFVMLFLPFFGGLMIGLFPVVYYLSEDPQLFLFNNLEYHTINTEYRHLTKYSHNMSISDKLSFARQVFFKADNLVLILSIFFILSHLELKSLNRSQVGGVTLSLALTLFLVPISTLAILYPTPIFEQYFAMPVSFLFVFIISLYTLVIQTEKKFRNVLVIFIAVSALYTGSSMLKATYRLTNAENWTGFSVSTTAKYIHDSLGGLKNGKVATLAPAFVIEANLPIYEEFATGPFLYRVSDLLTPDQQKNVTGISPDRVEKLFENEAPAAILVGFEEAYGSKSIDGEPLESSLIKYAERHNYKLLEDDRLGNGRLYILDD